jgi:hypothetical protein
VVTAASPVPVLQPQQRDHLLLGEQRALVQGGGQLLTALGQGVDRDGLPPRRLQVIRRKHAEHDGLADLGDIPTEDLGELAVVVGGGPACGRGSLGHQVRVPSDRGPG